MDSRCECVVMSLLGIAKKYKGFYCFPSQKTILGCIEKYHGYGISIRSLNRDLRVLVDEGWIVRVRRIRRDSHGRLVFWSTLYKFTGKLFNWLHSLGNRVKRLFFHFRLPKLAQHQALQKRASMSAPGSRVDWVEFISKEGRPMKYFKATGETVPA